MSKEQATPDEQLLLQLVTSLATGVWVAMGKLANPVTGKVERNMAQATYSLDTIEMLAKRMAGNLADWEEEYFSQILTDLKMNYLEEQKKGEPEPAEARESGDGNGAGEDAETPEETGTDDKDAQ
ncbi:MAG: DUF1844 domain-containing protein [Candidatus Neomarinimicrobiota bacterium]